MLSTRVKTVIAAICALVGLYFLIFSVIESVSMNTPSSEVRILQRRLSGKLDRLENYVGKPEAKLPDDMVIYQYRNDTLIHWRNQFPISEDGLLSSNPVWSNEFKLYSFAGQSYLAKVINCGEDIFVVGYRLDLNYSIMPSGYSGGKPVRLNNRVLFKLCPDENSGEIRLDVNRMWAAYAFLIVAILFALLARPGIARFLSALSVISAMSLALYFVGYQNPEIDRFSILHYSGNRIFYSLNVVPLLNIFLFAVISCAAITRKQLAAKLPPIGLVSRRISGGMIVFLLLLYTHLSLKNLILNTDMVLTFINLSEMTPQGFLIAVSYLLVLSMIALVIQLAYRKINIWEQVSLSVLLSAYLVIMASFFSFQKERVNMKAVTAALAMNRDLNTEHALMRIETLIQNDTFLIRSAFNPLDYSAENYIIQSYLCDITPKYDVYSFVMDNSNQDEWIKTQEKNLVIIAPKSHFYHQLFSGISRYVGFFPYYQGSSVRTLIVMLNQKYRTSSTRQDDLHPKYSYARYHCGVLSSFRGQYAYPTLATDELRNNIKYRHYIYDLGEDDQIIVSRKRIGLGNYISSIIFCSIIYLALLILFGLGQRLVLFQHREYFERNMLILSESLVLVTLLTIVGVSIMFIYSNNRSVIETLIAERISTLQNAMQSQSRHIISDKDVMSIKTFESMKLVSKCTETILAVYSADGRLVTSTIQPMINDLPAYRVPEIVRHMIIDQHTRYCYFRSRTVGSRSVRYEMYAPLFDKNGSIVAILRSPYYGVETYEMENDAVMHVVTLISFLLILLLMAWYITERFYTKMLEPLRVISAKMLNARLSDMERIQYDRQDEIRNLIDSYNLMVDKLESSALQLAEVERNQAWTRMARQVAHEIKNPLTPMKLQIQRVMRLKDKNDPRWQEKMEEASTVMLEHISVLTKTADEFSSFAKLYSEEHSAIDLDALIRQELSMYRSREDITFDYLGMQNAMISGPKPQLTRVVVNLLNNAVQAVDSLPGTSGKIIRITLSRSSQEGWLEISFQDNGPGVSSDDVGKLFTPNFTTKSGGSGLGLAISKSVLEQCGATITYSQSPELGGAVFTILYPCES